MKYIKLFNEAIRLKDIKGNRAPYYHASNNFSMILDDNLIKGITDHEYNYKKGISVSRNPNFIFNNARVVFILDGQKISNRYKVTQHNFWGMENPQRFEFEDFIIGSLTNLHKYIIGFGINESKVKNEDLKTTKDILNRYIKKWNLKDIKIYSTLVGKKDKDLNTINKFQYKNWQEIKI